MNPEIYFADWKITVIARNVDGSGKGRGKPDKPLMLLIDPPEFRTGDFLFRYLTRLMSVFQEQYAVCFDYSVDFIQKACRIIHLMKHIQSVNNVCTMIADCLHAVAEQYWNDIIEAIFANLFSDDINGYFIDVHRIDASLGTNQLRCFLKITTGATTVVDHNGSSVNAKVVQPLAGFVKQIHNEEGPDH